METLALSWGIFAVVVLGMLALDLFVIGRSTHPVKLAEALVRSGIWILLALAFAAGVFKFRGHQAGLEFLTAYLIEESLSMDNLFVFLLLFSYFQVPEQYRHKVLFWGILGALLMRFVFILCGVSLLRTFHALIYVFGAVLVYSGVKMMRHRGPEVNPERSPVLRLFRRVMPVAEHYEGDRFFAVRNARRVATPLLVVLVMVETTDLVFAVDSIPAVLAVSRDPFIVYTSNAFAILGLRSLFFALARLFDLFHYLHHGLSLILVFVGAKMLVSHWVEVPTAITLAVVGATLAVCVGASILWPRRDAGAGGGGPPQPPAAASPGGPIGTAGASG
jgi:tellurite resistance protein TerC